MYSCLNLTAVVMFAKKKHLHKQELLKEQANLSNCRLHANLMCLLAVNPNTLQHVTPVLHLDGLRCTFTYFDSILFLVLEADFNVEVECEQVLQAEYRLNLHVEKRVFTFHHLYNQNTKSNKCFIQGVYDLLFPPFRANDTIELLREAARVAPCSSLPNSAETTQALLGTFTWVEPLEDGSCCSASTEVSVPRREGQQRSHTPVIGKIYFLFFVPVCQMCFTSAP